MRAKERAWTVLVYAAGNNDLEAYLYDSLQMLAETVGVEDINIIMQISRSTQGETVVRDSTVHHELWHGTRLYVIQRKNAILVGDLGEVDMAEPKTLLNFIMWGATRFPSRQIMLIMSGHSAGFVGMMNDHSGEHPSFMGIQGFAGALGLFQQSLKRKIDILLFDTCYMDMVEIWHEITAISRAAVKSVILPQDNPPLQGLPYHLIIKKLAQEVQAGSLEQLLCELITSFNQDCSGNSQVFAITLVEAYFEKIRILTDKLAESVLAGRINWQALLQTWQLQHAEEDFISLPYLLDQLGQSDSFLANGNQEMREVLDKILLYPPSWEMAFNKNVGLKIYLPSSARVYQKFKKVYQQMLFSHDNKWIAVLEESYPLGTT